jgi:hypothetical protein
MQAEHIAKGFLSFSYHGQHQEIELLDTVVKCKQDRVLAPSSSPWGALKLIAPKAFRLKARNDFVAGGATTNEEEYLGRLSLKWRSFAEEPCSRRP